MVQLPNLVDLGDPISNASCTKKVIFTTAKYFGV
jgi:hypothetical protein